MSAPDHLLHSLTTHHGLDGHRLESAPGGGGVAGVARDRRPAGVLVDLLDVAGEVSRRSRRGAAIGASADRAGLLRAARTRLAKPARPTVAGLDRARSGIHLRGAGHRVDSV